jgi:hypothetical protein
MEENVVYTITVPVRMTLSIQDKSVEMFKKS